MSSVILWSTMSCKQRVARIVPLQLCPLWGHHESQARLYPFLPVISVLGLNLGCWAIVLSSRGYMDSAAFRPIPGTYMSRCTLADFGELHRQHSTECHDNLYHEENWWMLVKISWFVYQNLLHSVFYCVPQHRKLALTRKYCDNCCLQEQNKRKTLYIQNVRKVTSHLSRLICRIKIIAIIFHDIGALNMFLLHKRPSNTEHIVKLHDITNLLILFQLQEQSTHVL